MSIKTETKHNQNKNQIAIMNNSTNDFNKKKNKLKEFSEKIPKEEILPSVPGSRGPFGLFDYKVTGDDLNRLTQNIQDKMIKQNQVLVRTIKEFNTIYDTFSALDKEYIHGILISLKAAEEANAKALKGIEGVQTNQNEITQIINQQKQVIQVLKKFKEKIEKIEHLTDVDMIFGNLSTMQSKLKAFETKVEAQDVTLADLTDEVKSLLSSLSVFQDDFNYLKQFQVEQFQAVSNQNENISKIEVIITENKTNIETLNQEIDIHEAKLIDIKRLIQDDIQILSEKVVQNNSEFDTKLDSMTNEFTTNKKDIEDAIQKLNIGIEQQAESISAYIKTLNKEIDIHEEKLNDMKRLIQDNIQILSEKAARKNSELDAKLDSTTNEVTTNKKDFEIAIKKLNDGIEQQADSISTYVNSELSKAKDEIAELNLLTRNLSKTLKTTQIISFTTITIICILVVLIISGVL
ncbi:hypothetical protein [Paenibacillus odorifer]|uniref:hypothetical protein n=1 Tax=Paenibacillus odorifer TaxID=189426 RepID=UPI000BA0E7A5|nr:hypothetical protein [Paenibacillus odorifer]OZQ73875.1 hypothetical protein CA596_18370 [Paenibacillus odorifer]